MRRRLPYDSHEPLPIRLRISSGMTQVESPFSGRFSYHIGNARAGLEAVMRFLCVVAFSALAATAGIGICFGQTPATTAPAAKPAARGEAVRGRQSGDFPRPVRNRPTPKGCTGRNGRSSGASANAKVARHRELNAGDRRRFARKAQQERSARDVAHSGFEVEAGFVATSDHGYRFVGVYCGLGTDEMKAQLGSEPCGKLWLSTKSYKCRGRARVAFSSET